MQSNNPIEQAINYFLSQYDEVLGAEGYPREGSLRTNPTLENIIKEAISDKSFIATRVFVKICFVDSTAKEQGIAITFLDQLKKYLNEKVILKIHALTLFFESYEQALKGNQSSHENLDLNKINIFNLDLKNLIDTVLLAQYEADDPLYPTFNSFMESPSISEQIKAIFAEYTQKKVIADQASQAGARFFELYNQLLGGEPRARSLQSDHSNLQQIIDAVIEEQNSDSPLKKAFNQFFMTIPQPEVADFIHTFYLARLHKKKLRSQAEEEKEPNLEQKAINYFLEKYNIHGRCAPKISPLQGKKSITVEQIMQEIAIEKRFFLRATLVDICFPITPHKPLEESYSNFLQKKLMEKDFAEWLRIKTGVDFLKRYDRALKQKDNQLRLRAWEKANFYNITPEQIVDHAIEKPDTLFFEVFQREYLNDEPEGEIGEEQSPADSEVRDFFKRLYHLRRLQKTLQLPLQNREAEEKKEEEEFRSIDQQQIITEILEEYDEILASKRERRVLDLTQKAAASLSVDHFMEWVVSGQAPFLNEAFATFLRRDHSSKQTQQLQALYESKQNLQKQAIQYFLKKYDEQIEGERRRAFELCLCDDQLVTIPAIMGTVEKYFIAEYVFMVISFTDSEAKAQGIADFLLRRWKEWGQATQEKKLAIAGLTQFFVFYQQALKKKQAGPHPSFDPAGNSIFSLNVENLIQIILFEQYEEDPILYRTFVQFISKNSNTEREIKEFLKQRYYPQKAIADKAQQLAAQSFFEIFKALLAEEEEMPAANFNADVTTLKILINTVIQYSEKKPALRKAFMQFVEGIQDFEVVHYINELYSYRLSRRKNHLHNFTNDLQCLKNRAVQDFLKYYDKELQGQIRVPLLIGGPFYITPEIIINAVIQQKGKVLCEAFKEYLADDAENNAGKDFLKRLYHEKKLKEQAALTNKERVEEKEEEEKKESEVIAAFLEMYDLLLKQPSASNKLRVAQLRPGEAASKLSLEDFVKIVESHPDTPLEEALDLFLRQDNHLDPTSLQKLQTLYAPIKEKRDEDKRQAKLKREVDLSESQHCLRERPQAEGQPRKDDVSQFLDAYHLSREKDTFCSKSAWPKAKMTENEPTLEEIVLYAIANPNSRTSQVVGEMPSTTIKKWKDQLTTSHEKAVEEFLEKSSTDRRKRGCWQRSKWDHVDQEKISLIDIIEHARKSKLSRMFSFFTGERSYQILRQEGLDVRSTENQTKSSAQLAREYLGGRVRSEDFQNEPSPDGDSLALLID
ncbi:MAG: hypothetical protein K0S27_1388 [Gammaproteobacteria bacterium]|jgi:hypothetical protein|nr:hypothetical protein [Gammaproteobacteria bacterium]